MPYAVARKYEEVSAVEDGRVSPREGHRPPDPGSPAFMETEIDRMVDAYSDLICRVSYTYLKSTHDAEDVCQTVFMRLLALMGSGRRRFASVEHEKAWIIRATINVCKDVLKSAHRQRTTGFADLGAGDTGSFPALVEDEHPSDDDGSELRQAVNALPVMYREAIYLYYYEGYSVREIAAITGERDATVNAHLSRGRAKLREMLKGDTR